jgi:hypothetical protein
VGGSNPFEVSFDQLSLEPVGTGATPTAGVAPGNKATFRVDSRSGRDRRAQADRRVEFRLTPDRRSGGDRRPRKTWEPGRNL